MNLLDLARSALAPARCWQVRYPGLEPMEVIFCPEATRAEVAALYPGAVIVPILESDP